MQEEHTFPIAAFVGSLARNRAASLQSMWGSATIGGDGLLSRVRGQSLWPFQCVAPFGSVSNFLRMLVAISSATAAPMRLTELERTSPVPRRIERLAG
jgi:hypothetical protein